MLLSSSEPGALSASLALGVLFAVGCVGCASPVVVRGPVAVEARSFVLPPLHTGQELGAGLAARLEPEISLQSEDAAHTAVFRPFLRFDTADDARNHVDVRQADYTFAAGNLALGGGVGLFHWGVMESARLNDVVNQIDLVEDINMTQKLGQPYVRAGYTAVPDLLGGDTISFDLLFLPWQRSRTWPGLAGRLRPPTGIDPTPELGSPFGAAHPSAATRIAYAGRSFDVGVNVFSGLSREPRLVVQLTKAEVAQAYDPLQQAGFDASVALGDFLIKLEAVGRLHSWDLLPSWAVSVGVEYTAFSLFDSEIDLTLLVEAAYDERPLDAPVTIYDNDLFGGLRLAFNDDGDTTVLCGTAFDVLTHFVSLHGRVQRRLGEHWQLYAEAQVFHGGEDAREWWLARDHFGQLGVAYYL